MQITFTFGTFLALAVVVLLVLGSYWFANSSRRRDSARQRPRPSFGRPGASNKTPPSTSAESLRLQVKQLAASRAGWNDIFGQLNPNNDGRLAEELFALRGPHMFAPQIALQVIEHGCVVALQANRNASVLAALQAARESMEKVTRAGD